MKFVWIYHPKTKGEALVPESSVAHHKKAGWQLAGKKAPAPQTEPVTQTESAKSRGADAGKES